MKRIAILAVVALCPMIASADQITLNFGVGYLKTSGGSPLPTNSTLMILVDADQDGSFGDLTQSGDAWKADDGDEILGGSIFPLNGNLDGDGTGDWAFQWDTTTAPFAGGDKIMLAWYELPYDGSLTGPNADLPQVNFGTFREDGVADLDNGVAGWEIPTKSGTFELNAFTADAGGTAGFTGSAVGVVVPEPASMLLMLVGGGLLAARRRRSA